LNKGKAGTRVPAFFVNEASRSFLKKEQTHIEPIGGLIRKEGKLRTTSKSSLVLSFKKELLSYSSTSRKN
jgi:hypothetical protein